MLRDYQFFATTALDGCCNKLTWPRTAPGKTRRSPYVSYQGMSSVGVTVSPRLTRHTPGRGRRQSSLALAVERDPRLLRPRLGALARVVGAEGIDHHHAAVGGGRDAVRQPLGQDDQAALLDRHRRPVSEGYGAAALDAEDHLVVPGMDMERGHLPGLVAVHARDQILRGDQGHADARLAGEALEVVDVEGLNGGSGGHRLVPRFWSAVVTARLARLNTNPASAG